MRCPDRGRHAPQPPRARAPRQTQQHRLGLITARVRQGDTLSAETAERVTIEVEAGVAARHLQRLSRLAGQGWHIDMSHVAGQVKTERQRLHERRIIVGRAPADVVMEVGDAREPQLPLGGQRPQDQQQGDRVGSAGNRGDDPGVRGPQALQACKGVHAPRKVWHPGMVEGAGMVPEGGLEPPT